MWVPRTKGDTRARRDPRPGALVLPRREVPAYGNIVPRDIATREIFDVCVNMGMGVDGKNQVYLDLTHKDPDYLTRKLGGILEIYEKFVGEDPRFTPMKIFPAVHYSMGGLWTTYTAGSYQPQQPRTKHKSGSPAPLDAKVGHGLQLGAPNNSMTNIPGLYAFGEVNFGYHGANRLGANALLSCIFDGLFCGVSVVNYVQQEAPSKAPAADLSQGAYDAVLRQEQEKMKSLLATAGGAGAADPATNPYAIGKELGDEMTAACTVVRSDQQLGQCMDKLRELRDATRVSACRTARRGRTSPSAMPARWATCSPSPTPSRAGPRCAKKAAARTTAPTSPSATTPTS